MVRLLVSCRVVVVMVVPLLVGAAAAVALAGVGVADEQLGAVALDDVHAVAVAVAVVVAVAGLVEGLLAPQVVLARRVCRHLLACRLVEVLPGLAVVTVQAASAARGATVEARHRVAVGRGSVTVVLAAAAAVSGNFTKIS